MTKKPLLLQCAHGKSFSDFALEDIVNVESGSLLLLGFDLAGKVDLPEEMAGGTATLRALSVLSSEKSLVLAAGIEAKVFERLFLSAAVIDNGHIMGISDAAHTFGLYEGGSSFRVYDTSAGRIGIIVGEDIMYPESARVLAAAGADILVAVNKLPLKRESALALSSAALANGLPSVMVCGDGAMAADSQGRTVMRGKESFISKEITLINYPRYIEAIRPEVFKRVFLEKK